MTTDDLKGFINQTVILHMSDGEIVKVRVDWVDEEYGDLIGDVLETSQPEHYRDPSAVYTFAAVEIVSVSRPA